MKRRISKSKSKKPALVHQVCRYLLPSHECYLCPRYAEIRNGERWRHLCRGLAEEVIRLCRKKAD